MKEIITSIDNKQIKNLKKLFSDKKQRKITNSFACQSFKIINTFINNGYQLIHLFVSKSSKYLNKFKSSPQFQLITPNIYQSISNLDNGDGLIGVFNIKKQNDELNSDKLIILNNIQNPSNLGAILRSAAAFNIKNIILCNNSVDIFNPKVIQASMGNGYDLNFSYETDFNNLVNKLKTNGYKVFATGINLKSVKATKELLDIKCAVVFGNEGNGLKKQESDLCDQTIYIDINKKVDSLNLSIAASIIMFLMNK